MGMGGLGGWVDPRFSRKTAETSPGRRFLDQAAYVTGGRLLWWNVVPTSPRKEHSAQATHIVRHHIPANTAGGPLLSDTPGARVLWAEFQA